MPQMTQEQKLAITQHIINCSVMCAGLPPSLEEDVERLRDFYATTVGGAYGAVKVLFGDIEYEELKKLVNKVLQEKLVSLPGIIPRILKTGAETGIFKKHLYGQFNWEPSIK